MKKLCVIGYPVEHSLYPAIQRRLMELVGLDYQYDAVEVQEHELEDFVREAKAGAYAGFNVTTPHKRSIIPLLDEVSEEAKLCGAVNTVVIRDGKAYGYNNDSLGFMDSMERFEIDPKGKKVLLIGTGASGQAITTALVRAGAEKVTVCNRSVYHAQDLAARFPDSVDWIYFGTVPLRRAAAQADMIINATNLGMSNGKQFSDLGFLRGANPDAWLYDLVYSPRDTHLLQQGRKQGLKTIAGIYMVIPQIIEGFKDFTGHQLDPEAAWDAIAEMLGESERA